MAAKSTHRPVGRPPAGAHAGERVKDYPQLALRIPAESKAKLQALSLISSRPQWRLLTDAIELFLRERSPAERRQVDRLVGVLERRRRRKTRSTRRD